MAGELDVAIECELESVGDEVQQDLLDSLSVAADFHVDDLVFIRADLVL